MLARGQEVLKCALGCRYFAENAARILTEEPIPTEQNNSYVRWDPLGIVLAIMPWNFPFWQVFRFLSPALMAGNVALLKHSGNVPQCAVAIESLVRRAGFPRGTFQTLLIEIRQVEAVLSDERIAAVTVTGSEAAGRAVAAQAGWLLKRSVLELGGLRSVHRSAVSGPGPGALDRGEGPYRQQRPIMHCGEAFHRARRHLCRI